MNDQNYEPLPHLRFVFDSQVVRLDGAMQDANELIVPLHTALAIFTKTQVRLETPAPAAKYVIGKLGSDDFLWLPLASEATGEYSRQAKIDARTELDWNAPAFWITLRDGQKRLMIALRPLCSLLGLTVDDNDDSVFIFSSEFWCAQLGLNTKVTPSALRAG